MSNALAIFFLTISLNYHSLSKKECLEGNWFKAGKKDAYFGFKKNRISHHKDTCLKYNIKPDPIQYGKGHMEGLKLFCTKQRGYHWGITNKENPKTCPAEIESSFMKGFERGRRDRRSRN